MAATAAALHAAGALEWAERHLMDLRFRLAARPASGEVVVVAIDGRSLAALEVWPWPRGYHATVIDNLLEAGARRIALDIDFSSRSGEEDLELARALQAAGPRVILPLFRQWEPAPGGRGRLVETRPLPAFSPPASLGVINVEPDADGLVRRYGASWPHAGEMVPSLAAALRDRGSVGSFHLDHGIDPATIPQVSYLDVLTGALPPGSLAGKDVIVGATAIELGDQAAVPLRWALPGPVLQALAYESIASGRTLARTGPGALLAGLVILALVAGLPIQKASWPAGLAWVTGGTALTFAFAVAVQRVAPRMIDLAPLLAAMAGWYGVALVRRIDHQEIRLWLASRHARQAERRLWHVVQNSGEAILTLDRAARVMTLNRAAEQVFGVSQSAARGRAFEDLLGSAVPAGPEGGEVEIARPGGGRRLLEVTVSGRRVAFVRDVTEARERQAMLRHQATHDPLTDLPNRALLARRLAETLGAGPAGEPPALRAALLMADLDGFKEINDALGHDVGDALLKAIAARLDAGRCEESTLARLGGDEFALLIPGAGAARAETEARRLAASLEEPFELDNLKLRVEASVGIALHPDHAADPVELLRRADVAMYQAKRRRGSFQLYDAPSDLNSVRHITLKGELREAIERAGLELHYQPKLDLSTGSVAGVEALVRWRHARHGWLQPQEFVPMAERTGLIRPMTRHVLAMALGQAARWRKEGRPLSVAVNCSARNLAEGDFTDHVCRALEVAGLPPDSLVLEITETAVIEDALGSARTLQDLAGLGVRLSIDDFGTAYASLDYLRRLPACELKIDRSFVCALGQDRAGEAIVRGLISLAHNLGLRCVAEGVETKATLAWLRDSGCDQAQGFVIAGPMPAAELAGWLASRHEAPSHGVSTTRTGGGG